MTLLRLLCSIAAVDPRAMAAAVDGGGGSTALFIGQDLDSVGAYRESFDEYPPPAGHMSYISIAGNLSGLFSPVDYGTGIDCAQCLADKYPSSAINLALWLVDLTDGVVAGSFDAQIQELASWIDQAGVRVFLRIGVRFDDSPPH